MNISSLTFLLFLSFFSDLGGVKASICTEFACTCEQTFSNLFVTCTLLGNNSNNNNLTNTIDQFDSLNNIYFLKFEPQNSSSKPIELPDGLLKGYSVDMIYANNLGLTNLNPNTFEGVESIMHLNLAENKLTNIDFSTFSQKATEKIETLELKNNLLTQIPDLNSSKFLLLESIHLNLNKITNLTTLRNISIGLKDLDLSGNLICELDFEQFSPEMRLTLERIELNSNKIKLMSLLGSFPNLVSLSMYKNKLSVIKPDTFADLPNLETLDLSFNFLVHLPIDLFGKLLQLEVLNLAHNRLSELRAREFESLGNLDQLELQYNLLKRVNLDAFANLNNLAILDLSHNRIESIETSSNVLLTNLKILRLNENRLKVRISFNIILYL